MRLRFKDYKGDYISPAAIKASKIRIKHDGAVEDEDNVEVNKNSMYQNERPSNTPYSGSGEIRSSASKYIDLGFNQPDNEGAWLDPSKELNEKDIKAIRGSARVTEKQEDALRKKYLNKVFDVNIDKPSELSDINAILKENGIEELTPNEDFKFLSLEKSDKPFWEKDESDEKEVKVTGKTHQKRSSTGQALRGLLSRLKELDLNGDPFKNIYFEITGKELPKQSQSLRSLSKALKNTHGIDLKLKDAIFNSTDTAVRNYLDRVFEVVDNLEETSFEDEDAKKEFEKDANEYING